MNKESYSYYKQSYRANKRYRDKIGSDDYGGMLSESEYKEMKATGMTTKEIVYNQFHFYSKDVAKQIQESLKQEGFKVSIKAIQSRNYTQSVYNAIKERYHELTKTMSAKEAAALISYAYYGS